MVVGVVLILLLVNLYFLVTVFEPPPDGDGNGGDDPPLPDHPWNITVEPLVIDEEAEWVGRTGRLERPVVVADGALLRLDSCRLELHEEDILWFDGPYFQVEEGGVLEIVDSVLEVVPSPIPDDVLVGPIWSDRTIPQISRVVNLEKTEWPVLTFDLKWRFNGTPLSIAASQDPEHGLVELWRIDPEGPSEDWLHVEVSLRDYVNATPRIVIYPTVYPEDVYFIKDMNVTDGGKDLPYDLPPSENQYYGRWLYDDFVTYNYALSWNRDAAKVLDIQGHVYIDGSTIRVPREIERTGSLSYVREAIGYGSSNKNIWASMRGMHVEVDNGDLLARNSVFEHAPIMANSSQLDLGECRFESAYDMVTMWNCTALLSNSRFARKGLVEHEQYWDQEYARAIWAISVENNTGRNPTRIIDCEFRDVEQAIDLGYANCVIEDCTFLRVTELCIWDHASEGATEWEDLSSVNSFQYCTGYLYMRTGTTDLYFNGTYVYHWNVTIWDTEGDVIEDIKVYPNMQWSFWTELNARLVRLDMLVETVDRVRVMDHIDMIVDAETPPYIEWDDWLTVTIGAGVESMYVDLFPMFVEQIGYPWDNVVTSVGLDKVWPAGDAHVGTYNLTFTINSRELYIYNLSVDIYIDGEVVRHIDEVEFWVELVKGGRAYIDQTVYLEPGVHGLQVVVSGNRILNETQVNLTREVFADPTFLILRAAATSTPEEVMEFLEGEDVVLAIDAGTTIELDGLQPANGSLEIPSFRLTGGEDAGLTFRNLTYEPDFYMEIIYYHHVDLQFVDTEIPEMYFSHNYLYNTYPEVIEIDPEAILGEISLVNCTTYGIHLNLWQYALTVSDTECDGYISVSASVNSTVSFHNLTTQAFSAYAYGPIWSYTVTDSHFWGLNSSGFDIHAEDIRTLRFSNCTFEATSLHIEVDRPYKGPWELDVTDCEFSGNNSTFSMLWNTRRRHQWHETPASYPIPSGSISGNTFSGRGTAVVLHNALYGNTFVDNTIEDGARAWAWYWTKIEPRPETPISNNNETIILADHGLLTEFPVPNNLYLRDENYFFEVTEYLGGDLEPPPLRVVIQWRTARGNRLMVVDFAQVDLRNDVNVLIYPVWSDLQGVLPLYIEDWPWELDDWEGGRW